MRPRRALDASPGTLVLVVGASGVGKDSLIRAARRHFRADRRFAFPARTITRGDQTGEDHVTVDAEDFSRLEAEGEFFLSWEAHGEHYGIPMDVREALRAGRSVVVNVSRTVISDALDAWPCVRVVHVTVGPDILRERLLARRRETPADVERRLARADAVRIPEDARLERIDNSSDLATAVARFTHLLEAWAAPLNE